MTKQEQFIHRLEQLYKNNVDISRAKNADYAGEEDPFKNFKGSEMYGISAEQAILVRMGDKVMRISNLLKRDAKVSDESILDTCSDLANYAMILRMYIETKMDTDISV